MFLEMAFLFEIGIQIFHNHDYYRNCLGHTTLVSYSDNRGCEKEEEHT